MSRRLSYYENWIAVGCCISIVIILDLHWDKQPVGLSDVLSRLCVSYLAGCIIYVLAVALPRKQNQRNILESVGPRTRGVISVADKTLEELQRLTGHPFDRKLARLEVVEVLCKEVNPQQLTDQHFITNLSKENTVQEFLAHFRSVSEIEIQRILVFSAYLDTEFIKLLNRLLDSDYFRFCDLFLCGPYLAETSNLEWIAEQFFKYLQTINALEEYADSHLK